MNNNAIIDALDQVELSEEALNEVVGGAAAARAALPPGIPSSGWVCTISGECNGGGGSCNPWPF